MLSLLFLAEVSACALPDDCPTAAEIAEAVRAEGFAMARGLYENSGGSRIVEPARVTGVRKVVCESPSRDEPPAISCTVTVDYEGSSKPRTVRLVRSADRWVSPEELRPSEP